VKTALNWKAPALRHKTQLAKSYKASWRERIPSMLMM